MAVSHKYDAIYKAQAPTVPVAYLRALAHWESGQNPKNQTGSYRGLLQVEESDLAAYNKAHPNSKFTRQQMFEPGPNVAVWYAWFLRFSKLADTTDVQPIDKPDWKNPEYVKLLTAAWNSGWSSKAGVVYMAKWLAKNGHDVTHDNVFAFAKQASATKHLSNQAKKVWQKKVADEFLKQTAADILPGGKTEESVTQAAARELVTKAAKAPTSKGGNGWGWLILLFLFAQSKR